MQTKEEILKKYGCINSVIEVHCYPEELYVPMNNYAEQQAILFAVWLRENRWFHYENGKWYYTFEQGTAIHKKTYDKNYIKTSEELYKIFLIEQNENR